MTVDTNEPATPAPAGDAEVSHGQARGWLDKVSNVTPRYHLLAYVAQCEGRQQQAEREAAELKASLAEALDDWDGASWVDRACALLGRPCRVDKDAQLRTALQGKDEEITGLKAERDFFDHERQKVAFAHDELSRKLETAEREVATMRLFERDAELVARKALLSGDRNDLFEACTFFVEEGAAAATGMRPPDQAPPAKPLTDPEDEFIAAFDAAMAEAAKESAGASER